MKLPPKLLIGWRGNVPRRVDAQPIHYFSAMSTALAACSHPPAAAHRGAGARKSEMERVKGIKPSYARYRALIGRHVEPGMLAPAI
jgi:hypothetical protein